MYPSLHPQSFYTLPKPAHPSVWTSVDVTLLWDLSQDPQEPLFFSAALIPSPCPPAGHQGEGHSSTNFAQVAVPEKWPYTQQSSKQRLGGALWAHSSSMDTHPRVNTTHTHTAPDQVPQRWGFPGSPVVKNSPAKSGDTDWIPWSRKMPLSSRQLSLCTTTIEACRPTTRAQQEKSPQQEKADMQQQRLSIAEVNKSYIHVFFLFLKKESSYE